jgi:hypothetical protein
MQTPGGRTGHTTFRGSRLGALVIAGVSAACFLAPGALVMAGAGAAEAQVEKSNKKKSKDTPAPNSKEPSQPAPSGGQYQQTNGKTPTARYAQAQTTAEDLGDGKLEFIEGAIDFGKAAFGEELKGKFDFTNTGTGMLRVDRVRSSCGCTVPELDKKEYAPGESGTIRVTFKPKGTGKQSKTITVVTNSREQERIVLTVSATTIDVVRTSPKLAQFGEVLRGGEKTLDIAVDSIDGEFKILDLDVEGAGGIEYIKAEVLPEDHEWKIPATSQMPHRRGIRLTLDADAPMGRMLRKIKITTLAKMEGEEEQQERQISINAHASIVGDLRAAPATVRIHTVNSGDEFSGRTIVATRSGKPFEIKEVIIEKSTIPGMSVVYTPWSDDDGHTGYELVVSGVAEDYKGVYRGHMKVKTDIKGEQPLLVTFSGAVRAQSARVPLDKTTRPRGRQK